MHSFGIRPCGLLPHIRRFYMLLSMQCEYTLEDYYALPDERRVELIDAVIYDMSAPTLLHQLIGGKVYVMIQSFIEKKGGKCLPFYAPHMYPLQGKVGLALYDDELLIDLDTIADLIVDDLP